MSKAAPAPSRHPSEAALLCPRGFPMQHGLLNLIRKGCQVQCEPIKHFPFLRIGSEVANQPTFGRVRSEFFKASLIIMHVGARTTSSIGRERAALSVTGRSHTGR